MALRNISSSIAGTVSSIEKKPGEKLEVDDSVIVVECMKMLIPVVAKVAGRVSKISVREGDVIAENQIIAVIES